MLEGHTIEPIEDHYNDESDRLRLQSFYCTNPSIDNFLKQEAYHCSIEFKGNTSLMLTEGKNLIGYFTLVSSNIEFPNVSFSCLEVAKLAVDEDYQEIGIGSYLLDQISFIARQTNHRYITLDALNSQIEWYTKRGFISLKKDEVLKGSDLVYMYRDLYDEEIVSHFFDE